MEESANKRAVAALTLPILLNDKEEEEVEEVEEEGEKKKKKKRRLRSQDSSSSDGRSLGLQVRLPPPPNVQQRVRTALISSIFLSSTHPPNSTAFSLSDNPLLSSLSDKDATNIFT